MTMKAISVRQPWAWLIVNQDRYDDPKLLENRNWKTKHRGPTLIHASLQFDKAGYERVIAVRPDLKYVMPSPEQFERGGIVGQAEIVDVVDEHESWWFFGKHAFVLEKGMRRPFVPLKGKLSFFEVDAESLPYVKDTAPRLDAAVLEQMARDNPDGYFLKGSGVLKLLGAIRDLERNARLVDDMKAMAKAKDLQLASLDQMGQITTKDEGKPPQFYPYALLLKFDSPEAVKKAIADGAAKFE